MSEFSFETIANFDDHIDSSIEGYSQMDGLVQSMSDYFVKDGQAVYDLGCSTGRLLKVLRERHS